MLTIASHSPLNISETVGGRGLAWFHSKGPSVGNGTRGSNGYVTDDVTCPRKVKFVTPMCLEPNISKTGGDI